MCCTRLRHFVKLGLEAPVERYASPSFNQGRACCSSTACSALMVPTSMRVAQEPSPTFERLGAHGSGLPPRPAGGSTIYSM
eukprot:scaffold10192_cov59-Phaeocystis_antarctica.AAC.5